jgi:hypothetical protein
MTYDRPYYIIPNYLPIEGPADRHIEQLWDEIKKLKERVKNLEEKNELSQ